MEFRGLGLKTGVENDIVWSAIGSGFEEPGDTPPPKIPRSTYIIPRAFYSVLPNESRDHVCVIIVYDG